MIAEQEIKENEQTLARDSFSYRVAELL